MRDTNRSPARADATPSVTPRVIRRRYLIDPKRQLRAALMTTSVVAILAVVVNLGFAFLRTSQTSFLEAAAPQLSPVLERQDSTFSLVMILFSIALLVVVSFKTIVETHRTAGAVFAVKQRLARVKDGDLQVSLKLRRNDNLADLETPFNEMIGALRERALKDADTLESLAERIGADETERREIAESLLELARDKRRSGT